MWNFKYQIAKEVWFKVSVLKGHPSTELDCLICFLVWQRINGILYCIENSEMKHYLDEENFTVYQVITPLDMRWSEAAHVKQSRT